MDITKEVVNPNPRDKANPFSVLVFGFTFDLFKKGYNKTLEVEDLYNPLNSDRSKLLGNKIQRNWEKELAQSKTSNKKPSLMKAIIKTFWVEYAILGIVTGVMELGVRLVQPSMLGGMLDYFKPNSSTTKEEALWYAGIIVGLNFFSAMTMNHYILGVFHGGMRIRAACCALVYRKALNLSKTALGDTASGKIVNLLSNDVSRFDIVSMFIHQMWVGPVSALIVMALLYRDAGWSGILGVVVVFIIVPLQSYTGKLSAKYRKQTALRTDERVRLMDEIITGIQVIKMYAWEKPFEKVISLARRAEIKIITKSSYVRALFMTFNLFTTRLALFCTLLVMALSNEEITASRVFVFMSYFNILSMSMGAMFVRGISEIAEVIVGVRRLEEFLMNEEFESNESQSNLTDKEIMLNYDDIITLKDLTAKWNLKNSENVLENINLNISDGQLLGIIGPVGSGKTSLLNTLLGELEVTGGKMRINGTISYASQESWVFAATVRQNILFGAKYDKQRYQEVVKVCALEKDFEQFPNGDLSIVGDRGASLSGGQKARINLARAVYRDTDIYLLDDPLSAVDIHVSKHLYEQCICGYLKNKTRILVTHQVHYLKNANHIVILKNGIIEDEGTFKKLANSDNLYAKLLTAEPEDPEITKQKHTESESKLSRSRKSSLGPRKQSLALSELSLVDTLLSDDNDEEEEEEEEKQIQIKDLQEESSKGKIKGSILTKYFQAGGSCFTIFIMLTLYIGTQLAASGTDYWVGYWMNVIELGNKTESSASLIPVIHLSTEMCLTIYGIGILSLFVIGLSRSILFYKIAMWSSKNLHKVIFNSVVGATMRFFDTNPSGRILNRFSKDIGAIDELLPKVILDSAQILLLMAGHLLLVVVVNPYFLIMVFFLSLIFGLLRHIFLKSSKNIKRLEGIMRSPVFTHLNATLQGLTTIRAFGAQEILSDEFDKHQDYHSSAWYMFIAASSAFGFWLDLFCTIFVTVITFSFLTFGENFGITGGNVGLAISQATALTGLLQWGMRQSAEVSNQLMSVERVLEYNLLPKEIQPAKPFTPPKLWPESGQITFDNMGLRYFPEGSLVLKNITITIKPKEKVGVVGRTGAGKSSTISALFRLAPVEGSIKIDGIDTKNLSLETLRRKISIIPQDPVLFSGTLRYNLDPFEEYSDDVLYKAIEDVELKDPANIINRLENRVMDRGANYSVGQRQLICLARAIIKNNKILMLDEATANVDPQTDALIQKTIRRKFADCTVITVAHRLNTIMDSDKVLVMDAGRVLEFDHPHVLLQNKNGTFYKMVVENGKAVSEQLRKIAGDSYQRYSAVPE